MPKKKRTAKRRVDFVSQPEIYEITPLTDKPIGVKRLPPECRPRDHTEKDLESPEVGPAASSEEHEYSTSEVEIVDDSANISNILLTATKPPSKKKEPVSRRAKVFRGMPKFDLSEDSENTDVKDQSLKNKNNDKTMEDNSLLSPKELNAIKNGAMMKAKAASQLWSSLFCPKDEEAIFATDAYAKLNSWLLSWMERLRKKQQIEGENGRKGKKRRTDLEEEEDEEYLDDSGEEPPENPVILTGPTGCGKTAMVYCAAKRNEFQLLEIPPYEKRDKQFLEQKLLGASDTYNMKAGTKMPDIRDLFNPRRNSPTNLKRKIAIGFTLILIDECDLHYSPDTNFWSTLKQICANSLVPIVLTCNDYEVVRTNMLNREPALETFSTIHVDKMPSFQSFNAYLRQWLIGFTGKIRKNSYLSSLFEQKRGDFRAILNALQLDGQHSLSIVEKPTGNAQKQIDFKEFVLQSKRASAVDSTCGKTNEISWRAKQMTDLDYRREKPTRDWTTKVAEMDETRIELLSLLHVDVDCISRSVKPNIAVCCAALQRSYPDRIYATDETGLDYLPCLQMIHKCALRSRASRRHLHPFETIPPVLLEQLQLVHLYLSWLYHFKWLYLLGQIFKLSSVLCLIIASFERYLITSHWTFSGFEERTRWLLLTVVLFISIGIRFTTSVDVVILFNEQSVVPFRRYIPAQMTHREWLPNFFNLLTVIIPFGTLVFFNGGIVLMLRRQNVQQLRLLITELTMGYDYMKVRRRNIRAATNTLLLIISIYLISNLLSLFLSVFAFLNPGFLQKNYPHQYRISSDCSSLLTVVGNALRFPAHFISNGEVREHFKLMCCPPKRKVPFVMSKECETAKNIGAFGLRRQSERIENQWFSALLTTRQSTRRTVGSEQSKTHSQQFPTSISDELEAYVRGEVGRPQQQHGFCAVCNGSAKERGEEKESECCIGGTRDKQRHSTDEEGEELITGGEETGEDDARTMDEEEEEGQTEDDEGATDALNGQQSLPLLDLVELRFDPAEFSSIQQRV
ncbi:hypothetical protein niasHT_034587 [Heterodera trifolii]|uniref:ATPase AAA-type core domain-containing protein n=1 Tax=Heterodera trifolii TaxID=157864 RepID=A0ABD2IIR7_9BILA